MEALVAIRMGCTHSVIMVISQTLDPRSYEPQIFPNWVKSSPQLREIALRGQHFPSRELQSTDLTYQRRAVVLYTSTCAMVNHPN